MAETPTKNCICVECGSEFKAKSMARNIANQAGRSDSAISVMPPTIGEKRLKNPRTQLIAGLAFVRFAA